MTSRNRKAPIDPITGTATTGHEWDGLRELNTPLAALVALAVLRHHRLGDRLLDRLSGLAIPDLHSQGLFRLAFAQRRS